MTILTKYLLFSCYDTFLILHNYLKLWRREGRRDGQGKREREKGMKGDVADVES